MEPLQTVEISTGPEPAWSVIWLHGLGADGHDFEPLVPELDLDVAVRFVFPHAPVRKVTINAGMPMRAWYDIFSLERSGPEDEAGIRESGEQVLALVTREEERGIVPEHVVLAGLIALSAYLPLPGALVRERASENETLPIFMAHGSADPTVPMSMGEHSRDQLRGAGYDVTWRSYAMGHSVCGEEISDLNDWLRARGLSRG